jgi:hypothetical protein
MINIAMTFACWGNLCISACLWFLTATIQVGSNTLITNMELANEIKQ